MGKVKIGTENRKGSVTTTEGCSGGTIQNFHGCSVRCPPRKSSWRRADLHTWDMAAITTCQPFSPVLGCESGASVDCEAIRGDCLLGTHCIHKISVASVTIKTILLLNSILKTSENFIDITWLFLQLYEWGGYEHPQKMVYLCWRLIITSWRALNKSAIAESMTPAQMDFPSFPVNNFLLSGLCCKIIYAAAVTHNIYVPKWFDNFTAFTVQCFYVNYVIGFSEQPCKVSTIKICILYAKNLRLRLIIEFA